MRENYRLLEVKCPYSARTLTIDQAVQNKKIKYLEKNVNKKFNLKTNSPKGYYERIQGLMGITGLKMANLVVWTPVDMIIVVVDFDNEFYTNRLLPFCEAFFRKHVVPSILMVKYDTADDQGSETELTADIVDCGTNILIRDKSPSPEPNFGLDPVTSATTLDVKPVAASPDNSEVFNCRQCNKVLPDEPKDNSEASVACDCPNCGGCNVWFC